jgi:hypothetical protein
MSQRINEADWKLIRQLHPIALERFCQRVLFEIERLVSDTDRSAHERYSAVFKLIERRDRELADAFDDLRRSTALRQLICIQAHELLTEEELSGLSPETREAIRFLATAHRP